MTVARYQLAKLAQNSSRPRLIGKCLVCRKRITFVRSNPHLYCSRTCYNAKRKGSLVRCTECRREWYRLPSQARRGSTRCSKKCASAFVGRTYRGASAKRLVEARQYVDHTSPTARERKRRITLAAYAEGRLKPRLGAASNLWKGGIACLQNRMRHTAKYKAWRKAVYERDKYKCRRCGTGKDLHAHHIKEFSTHPRLRYVVSNGLTFCRTCHSKHHGRPIPNIGKVNKK